MTGKNIRILLIGNTGQLGWELERTLSTIGQVTPIDYPQLNLNDGSQIRNIVRSIRPNIIINPAAYTAVDQAEKDKELAQAVNGIAPGILAEEARALRAAFIHYSTDYVFDGTSDKPYQEDDLVNPINIYGHTKLSGEKNVQDAGGAFIILRTSWVYSFRRPSFASKVLEWARTQQVMKVVTDQVGSPTWCRVLAEATTQALAIGIKDPYSWVEEKKGIYHLAGDGYVNRYDFAHFTIKHDPHKEEQIVKDIIPSSTKDFITPAERPLFTGLNCDRFFNTFNLRLPPWKDALLLAMAG
jgi:dTDP-4-dehydrorhamnose reductase